MFCGLGEERTKFRKKKRGKKNRPKPHHRQKCVGWDEKVS